MFLQENGNSLTSARITNGWRMYRGWFHVLLFSLFVSVGRVLDFSSKLVGIASKHLLMCFVFLIRDIGIFSNNSWVERFFYDDVRVWNNKFSEALKIISFINSSRVISNLIRSVDEANGKFPSNSRLIFLKKLLRKVGVIAHLCAYLVSSLKNLSVTVLR